jgi:hypothetical protein
VLFKDVVAQLKLAAPQNQELAYLLRADNTPTYTIPGPPNLCAVKVSVPSVGQPFLAGYIHLHFDNCPSPIFSPDDFEALASFYFINETYYSSSPIIDENFTFTLVTGTATYVMVIDEPNAFENFCNKYVFDGGSSDLDRLSRDFESYDINRTNTDEENEKRYLQFLKRISPGLKVLKANSDLSGYSLLTLDRNGNRVAIPCN